MFGLIGKIVATPGSRDELMAILQAGTTGMPGCLAYLVAADRSDADTLWVTESWESEEHHQQSLALPAVKAAIAKGRPLIAGFERVATTSPAAARGPARAGVLVYALDLERLTQFYETAFGMRRHHATFEMVALRSPDTEVIVHQIPPQYAAGITVETPPAPREDSAFKPYFAVTSLADAAATIARLGGVVLGETWSSPGMTVRNGCDPEGNIFQVREIAL